MLKQLKLCLISSIYISKETRIKGWLYMELAEISYINKEVNMTKTICDLYNPWHDREVFFRFNRVLSRTLTWEEAGGLIMKRCTRVGVKLQLES